jgi:hypothetical protein
LLPLYSRSRNIHYCSAFHTMHRYHFSLDDLKGVGPSFCRAIAAAWCPSETSTHMPLHPAIRQALADPSHPVVAACRKDGPVFAYPPPPPAHGYTVPRLKPAAAAAQSSPLAKSNNEDDAQSNSSESQENSEATVVRVPPPRADINCTPVFALSLSLLQQASAAAAAISKSTKQGPSLIDCIPGFEIVSASCLCRVSVRFWIDFCWSRCGRVDLLRKVGVSTANAVQTAKAAKTEFA